MWFESAIGLPLPRAGPLAHPFVCPRVTARKLGRRKPSIFAMCVHVAGDQLIDAPLPGSTTYPVRQLDICAYLKCLHDWWTPRCKINAASPSLHLCKCVFAHHSIAMLRFNVARDDDSSWTNVALIWVRKYFAATTFSRPSSPSSRADARSQYRVGRIVIFARKSYAARRYNTRLLILLSQKYHDTASIITWSAIYYRL